MLVLSTLLCDLLAGISSRLESPLVFPAGASTHRRSSAWSFPAAMSRRGDGSRQASHRALLAWATASFIVASGVKADIADAMPAFVSRPILSGRCKANEELCPVSVGSNELHVSVATMILQVTATAVVSLSEFRMLTHDLHYDVISFSASACQTPRPAVDA